MVRNYEEYELNLKEKTKYILISAAIILVISYAFYNSLWPMLILPIAVKMGIKRYSDFMVTKRKEELLYQFKDLLYSISSSIATGRHMRESLEEGLSSLMEIYSNDDLIIIELEDMTGKMRNTNLQDIEVLQDFAIRSKLDDIQNFTEVYGACKVSGGNFILAINKAANVIGEKISIERDIKLMISQKKFEGKIITFMPIAILFFFYIMSPDYIKIMYETFGGRIIMTVSLGVTILA